MLKRILEIIIGLAIGISLFSNYADKNHESQLLIWYVFTPKVLKIIVWVVLFFVASRLLSGTPQDYSKFFYNLFDKLFGGTRKSDK